jgi:hypothetical protein
MDFIATLPEGTLCLRLPSQPDRSAPDAVSSALALSEHESMLTALEAWLGVGLLPRPVLEAESNGSKPRWTWADWSSSDAALGFEWPLLCAIDPGKPAPEALRWRAMDFRVELARFAQAPWPEGHSAADAPGSVLLLPPSFAPAWQVRLHNDGLCADAEWDGPGHSLVPSGTAQFLDSAEKTAPVAWQVCVDQACALTPPVLLGWHPGALEPLAEAASLHGPEGQRWPGRIAPALHGVGLWL